MPAHRPTLIVFQGGALLSGSPLEEMVAGAQSVATLDLLDKAQHCDAFHESVLVTEHKPTTEATNSGVRVVEAGQPFHFGRTLLDVCKTHNLERVVYIGGGAMPLATERELRDLALTVSGEGACVTSNNLYSADVAAFYPASALERIDLPATDNDLAWLLHFKAGLPFAPMPRTLSTQFDIDTPTDLATLWWSVQTPPLSNSLGSHLSKTLQSVPAQMPRLADNIQRAYKVMATRRAEVLVAGRVSSWVWRRLETNLPCQTRIVSEERGMRASGKEERGEVRSLLGLYTDIAGIPGLISAIEQTCDAAFLDTRVLFAHRNLKPSPQDRFASDALMPELIVDPWIREFTEAVVATSVPMVLGGHSLVSGGVWALSERVRGGGGAVG